MGDPSAPPPPGPSRSQGLTTLDPQFYTVLSNLANATRSCQDSPAVASTLTRPLMSLIRSAGSIPSGAGAGLSIFASLAASISQMVQGRDLRTLDRALISDNLSNKTTTLFCTIEFWNTQRCLARDMGMAASMLRGHNLDTLPACYRENLAPTFGETWINLDRLVEGTGSRAAGRGVPPPVNYDSIENYLTQVSERVERENARLNPILQGVRACPLGNEECQDACLSDRACATAAREWIRLNGGTHLDGSTTVEQTDSLTGRLHAAQTLLNEIRPRFCQFGETCSDTPPTTDDQREAFKRLVSGIMATHLSVEATRVEQKASFSDTSLPCVEGLQTLSIGMRLINSPALTVRGRNPLQAVAADESRVSSGFEAISTHLVPTVIDAISDLTRQISRGGITEDRERALQSDLERACATYAMLPGSSIQASREAITGQCSGTRIGSMPGRSGMSFRNLMDRRPDSSRYCAMYERGMQSDLSRQAAATSAQP